MLGLRGKPVKRREFITLARAQQRARCRLSRSPSAQREAQMLVRLSIIGTLEMCKQHLNALSIVARSLECFSLGQRASNVTSFLVDAARHPTERRLRAAMRLQ